MRRRIGGLVGAAVSLFLLGAESPARADWPVFRHDPARTAYAPGSAGMTQPTLYWEVYLGGTLSGSTHLAQDVDGDGIVDLLYLAGGKAIVKHADDTIVWETVPQDFATIHGVADLDGDGVQEIVVDSGRNVFVLSGLTGQVLWKNPDGEVGQVGGVRLADLDGDGRPEVVIDDCACCGVTPTANPPGGVYHFSAGAMATKLYAPLTRTHCGSQAVTLGNFENTSADDVAYLDGSTVIFTKGATGATLGTSATIGQTLYYASCVPANVDQKPGDELVCFENTYQASTGMGGRQLFAVGYDATANPPVSVLYNVAPVPAATGQLKYLGNAVTDLDGDGLLEITVAWYDGSAWATDVHDAATGNVLATVPAQLEGIVDVDGDKLPEVVTSGSSGLTAWKFSRTATTPLTQLTTFPTGWHVPAQYSYPQAELGGVVGQPLAIDLMGNGHVVPVFTIDAQGSSPASYQAALVTGGSTSMLAAFAVPAGISMLTNQVFPGLNRTYPQLVLTRNDGYLTILDSSFNPTNGGTFGTPEFPVVLPGMRIGGFIGSPIAPSLGGTGDAVVFTDSRGTLDALDASAAWMAVPPTTTWSLANASSPSTSPTIDSGKPGLTCTVGTSSLVALRADGSQIWSQAFPSGTSVTNDALPGDVNGDGVSDAFVSYTAAGAQLNLQVFSGKDGTPIWSSPVSQAEQWGFEPFALADHDGDGILDMYVVSNTLQVLNGVSGATLAQNTTFLAYFTPTIADVDGDGVNEITLSRGYYPARTLRHDLTTTMWTGPDDRPYQHGARAACTGGVSMWVQPSTQTQGMLRVITMNGTSAGNMQTLYLAGGAVYPTATAASAAGFLGALGDVVVKQDLLGTGDHPSAVLGSSDGYVYALNPCTATLDWAYNVKFAVGNPIFADPTGSGVDQLLVPAADGYVHALQQQVLPAPAWVYDNAASGSMVVVGPDLDTVETMGTLAASWAPVTGADGYQVAALTAGGSYITEPDWVSVGNVNAAAVENLSLAGGKKYFFSVRAISKSKGSSPATTSNGVVVEIPDGGLSLDGGFGVGGSGGVSGAGGAGGMGAGGAATGGSATAPSKGKSGCGCRVAGEEGAPPAALALIALSVLGAKRRRRRR